MGAALTMGAEAAAGFFGKIPARGDFVRAGLPRSFTDPWDDWMQAVLAGSRDLLGETWLAAWMEAPIWHFRLPAGQCGPAPALGVWMPSVDAAGRHFPLTLALCGPAPADAGAWLAEAEAVGLEALARDLPPGEIAARLTAPAGGGGVADADACWWTEGSPFVPATRLSLAGLPDVALFARMLHAEAQTPQPSGAGGI
jgi:type VI secretion system protein ImpM